MDYHALFWSALITAYIAGSYKALELFHLTVVIEKELQQLGLDYKIRNKTLMYAMCAVFSWIAYIALKRQQGIDL